MNKGAPKLACAMTSSLLAVGSLAHSCFWPQRLRQAALAASLQSSKKGQSALAAQAHTGSTPQAAGTAVALRVVGAAAAPRAADMTAAPRAAGMAAEPRAATGKATAAQAAGMAAAPGRKRGRQRCPRRRPHPSPAAPRGVAGSCGRPPGGWPAQLVPPGTRT